MSEPYPSLKASHQKVVCMLDNKNNVFAYECRRLNNRKSFVFFIEFFLLLPDYLQSGATGGFVRTNTLELHEIGLSL